MEEDVKNGSKSGSKLSRRAFLKTAAAGAAAAGAVATVPGLLAGISGSSTEAFDGAAERLGGSPLVAYIDDLRAGEIVIMAGDREMRIRDLGIVSSLVRAVAGV